MSTNKVLENLAHMKFMIRANTKIENVNVKEIRVDEDHWRLDMPDLPEIKSSFIKASHSDCQQLGFGRYSFKNFNPTVDKLRKKLGTENLEEACAVNEAINTVTEEDMTDRYCSLISTLEKKLKTKRAKREMNKSSVTKVPAKKAMFKEPQE